MEKRKWNKEEIEEYRKNRGAFFYCNKEDSNFLIPKAYGIGFTVNWANPVTWVIVVVIIGLIIWRKF
jgi:Predicted membrane protein